MKYLVDTCVISELSRRKPNAGVLKWLAEHQLQDEFFVSTVSIGELRQGIAELADSDVRKARLSKWFEQQVLPAFREHVLDYDQVTALKWGDIMGETKRSGHVRPDLDAQIAATAVVHGMTILTRNVSDMAFTGARTCNPFE